MQFLQNINGYFLNQLISICKEIIINVRVVTHCELFLISLFQLIYIPFFPLIYFVMIQILKNFMKSVEIFSKIMLAC